MQKKIWILGLVISILGLFSILWAKSVRFHKVNATDGTFTVQVPQGWSVPDANSDLFTATNPAQEVVSVYILSVPSDVRSEQLLQQIDQMDGNLKSKEAVQLLSRIVSPPLSPREVVSILFPKIQPKQILNMQVVDSKNLPPEPFSQGNALVRYRFVLRNNHGIETPMEGVARIATTSELITPIYKGWYYTYQGAEAPPKLFKKHLALYEKIFNSFQYDLQVIQQRQAANMSLQSQVGNMYMESNNNLMQQIYKNNEEMGRVFRNCCNEKRVKKFER